MVALQAAAPASPLLARTPGRSASPPPSLRSVASGTTSSTSSRRATSEAYSASRRSETKCATHPTPHSAPLRLRYILPAHLLCPLISFCALLSFPPLSRDELRSLSVRQLQILMSDRKPADVATPLNLTDAAAAPEFLPRTTPCQSINLLRQPVVLPQLFYGRLTLLHIAYNAHAFQLGQKWIEAVQAPTWPPPPTPSAPSTTTSAPSQPPPPASPHLPPPRRPLHLPLPPSLPLPLPLPLSRPLPHPLPPLPSSATR